MPVCGRTRGVYPRFNKAAGCAARREHLSGFHVPGQFCGSSHLPIPAAPLAVVARFRTQDVDMVSDRGNDGSGYGWTRIIEFPQARLARPDGRLGTVFGGAFSLVQPLFQH